MQAKPVVDGIERDLAGSATIVRVDLLSDFGQTIAKRYGVQFTPTFLFLDRAAAVVLTTRTIDHDGAVSRLRQLAGS